MSLLGMNLFKGGFFKQLKYLLSTTQRVQRVLFISEAGVVSQELLPLHTGFVCAEEAKKAWVVLHTLKFQVRKHNEVIQDESVLAISERSYIPLNPLDTIKPKDRERSASLKDIARLRHAEARAEAGKQQDTRTELSQFIVTGSFIMLGIFALITLIQGC